jgi:hypothetical protein
VVFTLTAGEVIHIGGTVTRTVLAIEGELILFGLETPARASASAGDVVKDGGPADRKHRRNGWECN